MGRKGEGLRDKT